MNVKSRDVSRGGVGGKGGDNRRSVYCTVGWWVAR
jgi:hypothetical protein